MGSRGLRTCLVLTVLVLVVPLLGVVTLARPAAAVEASDDPAQLVSDTFEPTTRTGWGTAPTGGAWTIRGVPERASVSAGTSSFVMPAPMTQHADLRSVSSTDAKVTTEFSVDKLYQGSAPGYYVAATARQVGSDVYTGRIVVDRQGTVRLYLLRNFHNIVRSVVVPNLTITPGARYKLSVEATGTSPTTVSAKVWAASAAEPTAWQLRGTDSRPALQRPGHVGLFVYMPGSTRNVPVTTTFHSFDALGTRSGTAPAPVPPSTPAPRVGPVSFSSVAALRASGMFRIPEGANLVVWNHGDKTLEEVFMTLGANDILVLPERRDPYLVDSSDGFRAAGVASVLGKDNKRIPVVSTYKGKSARTWFAMARAQRGIIGMGPGAVITTTDSGFRQEEQIEDKGSPLPGGGTSPGRFWWTTSGAQGHELVGSQEKVIETAHSEGYYANFTMRGRDFGGVAYSAISMRGGTAERLDLDGAWRGFSGVPNGETAAINVNGGRYLISRVSTSPLNEAGKRVGSSPIMINSSPGGRWEYGESSQARAGMPTIWRSSGRHEWYDVTSRWGGPGVNLEQAQDGFEFVMTGGRLWPNRANKGGNPSPDGIFNSSVMHMALHAVGRATITLNDVDLDQNIQAGKLCVQLYGGTDPRKVKIAAFDDGRPVPVTAYGARGPVTLP